MSRKAFLLAAALVLTLAPAAQADDTVTHHEFQADCTITHHQPDDPDCRDRAERDFVDCAGG